MVKGNGYRMSQYSRLTQKDIQNNMNVKKLRLDDIVM